jgi:hypothetical protein
MEEGLARVPAKAGIHDFGEKRKVVGPGMHRGDGAI